MKDDPLSAFIARSLRGEVTDVASELVTKNTAVEIERIRFRLNGEAGSLVVKRVPPGDPLEVQLLPFLARKTDRVLEVRSRGIPPQAVPAWPWVLTEDLLDAASACHGDPRGIVRAKVTLERAVASDGPALKALGVRALTPLDLVERAAEHAAIDRPIDVEARAAATELAALPAVLCHGELVCANARATPRGVVLVEWRHAYLGCGLLDIARLSNDLSAFRGKDVGGELFDAYANLTGARVSKDLVRAARLVESTSRSSSA